MSYRILFILNALVAVALGIGALVVPTLALQQIGVDEYASTKLILQFFGTGLLTMGLLIWFAKDVTDPATQRGLGIAMLVGSLAGLVMSIIGTFNGSIRTLGWLAIAIYLLFTLGYGFLVFLRPRMKEPVPAMGA